MKTDSDFCWRQKLFKINSKSISQRKYGIVDRSHGKKVYLISKLRQKVFVNVNAGANSYLLQLTGRRIFISFCLLNNLQCVWKQNVRQSVLPTLLWQRNCSYIRNLNCTFHHVMFMQPKLDINIEKALQRRNQPHYLKMPRNLYQWFPFMAG